MKATTSRMKLKNGIRSIQTLRAAEADDGECKTYELPHYLRCRRAQVVLTLILIAVSAGCSSRSNIVEIEYDQRLNFDSYQMPVAYGGGGHTTYISANGMWLVYHMCSIKNEKSEAQPFNFDLSKFYVLHNGQEYHPTQFSYDDLTHPSLSAAEFPVVYQQFRQQVFTAPNNEVVPPNTTSASINWRFAILVRGPIDPDDISLELRYDNSAGESIHLVGRGWEPQFLNEASQYNLSSECRPKK